MVIYFQHLQHQMSYIGMNNCDFFCSKPEEGKVAWTAYVNEMNHYEKEAGQMLGNLFDTKYGYSAMHKGPFPHDWVKPGGLSTYNYR